MRAAIALAALWCAAPALADEPSEAPADPTTSDTPASTDAAGDEQAEPKKGNKSGFGEKWMLIPGAFYSQETSVGFAAFATVNFKMPKAGEETWNSTLNMAAVATLEAQFSATVFPIFYFGKSNTWVLEGELGGEHFPTRYYGLGPESTEAFQNFTRDRFGFDMTLRRRVHGNFFVGVKHELQLVGVNHISPEMNEKDEPVLDPSDDLLETGILGWEGSLIHGVSAAARYDGRDNYQSSRRGFFADFNVGGFIPAFGSTHGFFEAVVDLRGFVPVGNGTFAAQGLAELRTGDVPFTAMSEAGGDNMLRGIYEGRFRDHSMIATQIELRYPVIWRFGFAVFAATGQVFRNPKDIVSTAPVWSVGGGIRFELDPVTHSNIRLDAAGSTDGFGVTFTFGEAF